MVHCLSFRHISRRAFPQNASRVPACARVDTDDGANNVFAYVYVRVCMYRTRVRGVRDLNHAHACANDAASEKYKQQRARWTHTARTQKTKEPTSTIATTTTELTHTRSSRRHRRGRYGRTADSVAFKGPLASNYIRRELAVICPPSQPRLINGVV